MDLFTNQLNALAQACDTEERELIEAMVLEAADYVQAVIAMETKAANYPGRQGSALREAVAEADSARSKIHDSLMVRVNVVNRICAAHGHAPIYIGDTQRRNYGEFAFGLVSEIFGRRK